MVAGRLDTGNLPIRIFLILILKANMINLEEKRKLYSIFRVKKPNGKFRVIMAPREELKKEQKQIALKLNKVALSGFCYGFRKGFSVPNATAQHTGKDWVFKVDIKDFFPSITIEKLMFLSEYEREVVTLDGKLVQGSPCSPVISNMVFRNLDNKFGRYFKSLNISYTRYADDIVISGIGDFSKEYFKFIKENLEYNGFKVNDKKVKLMFKNERMEALGVTLNGEDLSCNRESRKVVRTRIYKGKVTSKELGYLAYVRSINVSQYTKLIEGLAKR